MLHVVYVDLGKHKNALICSLHISLQEIKAILTQTKSMITVQPNKDKPNFAMHIERLGSFLSCNSSCFHILNKKTCKVYHEKYVLEVLSTRYI